MAENNSNAIPRKWSKFPYEFSCECGGRVYVTSAGTCDKCHRVYYGDDLPNGQAECICIGTIVIRESSEAEA